MTRKRSGQEWRRGRGRGRQDQSGIRRDSDGLFVEAIAAIRDGADTGRCHRQGDRFFADKNQTILGDSDGRQGGRRALYDGNAPVSSFSVRWATPTHARDCGKNRQRGAIDTGMKTFHECLAMREGLWLNDKNAVIGLSRLYPLPKNSAVNKSLAKGPKPGKAKLGVAAATP